MIKFRQKKFTIPEGHYTGPKDMDKVPGVIEMVGKSALAGSGIGAVVGGLAKDSSVLSGAVTGGKYGTITGFILKFFLNYLHNPMSTIKYQEVDKLVRREFGIYRMSGITVGDSIDKRASLDEKFAFNDRNVSSYKINIAVQNNSVTMYTFGLTDKELERCSGILDYYCKKYFAMEYSSNAINSKINAYSVAIVFTNYQVISNFIMELSNELKTKINLLDNKALVDNRLSDASQVPEEREFSVKSFNKYDLMKLLGRSGMYAVSGYVMGGVGRALDFGLIGTVMESLNKLSADEITKVVGKSTKRGDFGNPYLEDTLKKMGFVEKYDYTVGAPASELNMSMTSGVFLVTVGKGTKLEKAIDRKMWDKHQNIINRVDTGEIILYSYPLNSKNEFELILRKLMSTGSVPNIFEK